MVQNLVLIIGTAIVIAKNGSLTASLTFVASYHPRIYVMTVLSFFFLVAYSVCKQLECIERELISYKNDGTAAIAGHSNSCDLCITEEKIKTLRRQHFLVCQTVKKMNNYFGCLLLLLISYTFISTINYSVYLYANLVFTHDLGMILADIHTSLDQILLLFLVTYISDHIREEVIGNLIQFFCFSITDSFYFLTPISYKKKLQ